MDYFDIDVQDVITAPTAQNFLDACYDAADLNNQFCSLFTRAGAGGGPAGEEQFRVIEGSLQQTTLNYAKSIARGSDVEASYNRTLSDIGKLSTRLVYTRALTRDDFLDPANPGYANRIVQELGDPRDAFNFNSELKRGSLTIGYQLRYLGKMLLNAYEDVFSLQGNPPQNEDWADRRYYPSIVYHDLRGAYDFGDSWNAYLGVDNVANKVPPLGLTGVGAGSGIYEPRGRFFYGGVKVKF